MMTKLFSGILIFLFFAGCQTAYPPKNPKESREEIEKALESVAGAMNGKPLTKEEMRELKRQIVTDTQARSAVEAITHSMGDQVKIKYCPVGGERYSARLETCPSHHVPLKFVDE